MEKDNVILQKSMEFSIRIVNLYKYLQKEKKETVLSNQLLRSGTSIGANVREGVYGQRRGDFLSKMRIALKESSETEYWLELLSRTGYINEHEYESIKEDCSEIARLLTAIVKSLKKKMFIVNCSLLIGEGVGERRIRGEA